MRGTKAKQLRRESRERGDEPHIPVYGTPQTLKIQGQNVYIPRKERRKLLRTFATEVRKGRIDMNALIERMRQENDRPVQG